MKKYYLNDGGSQQGPFSIEELQSKNITASTPIWYEGLGEWTTAGQIEELKNIIAHAPPPYHAPAEEAKPATLATEKPAETIASTAATTSTTATVAATTRPKTVSPKANTGKKKTAWVSWALYLAVLGGVGYLVYQDMEKKKGNTSAVTSTGSPDSTSIATNDISGKDLEKPTTPGETHEMVVTNNENSNPEPSEVVTANKENAASVPPAVPNKTKTGLAVNEKAKTTSSKIVDPKIAAKKAEEEKQKQQAAAAAAALKEKEYRNNWPRYVTFGNIDYTTHDGIEPFDVPVYNGTNATIDKVTVRVDYMKKDKKVFKSETITIYNIPPGGGVNGKAAGNNKGNNVKTYITGINSRKLHFCFPSNNGSDDPYYCN